MAPRAAAAGVRSPLVRLALLAAIGLAGGGAVAFAYWAVELRPKLARTQGADRGQEEWRPSAPRVVRFEREVGATFDRHLELSGDPLGMTAGRGELLAANRAEPWGFLRLRRRGEDAFEVTSVPVIERTYNQRVGVSAVTWNGTHYVGYAMASWFGRGDGYVFTLHDPDDLQIEQVVEAPTGIGAIAWDGVGYWVGARKNTRDADEPEFLDRLDRNFARVARYPAPGVGCQGLAWDGSHLWWVDVFSDRLVVLDVSGAEPRVVHSQESGFQYLSGIAELDGELWIAEYGNDRLHRLNPRFRAAWSGKPASEEPLLADRPAAPDAARENRLPAAEVARLQQALRSEDRLDSESARFGLRQAGAPIPYARYRDPFASSDPGLEDIQIRSLEVELEDGAILGSWDIFFGEGVFGDRRPATLIDTPLGDVTLPILARYFVRVEGGSLRERVEREFEARPGSNVERRLRLVGGLEPGEYEIDVFIHVQFIDQAGTARVVNEGSHSLPVSF